MHCKKSKGVVGVNGKNLRSTVPRLQRRQIAEVWVNSILKYYLQKDIEEVFSKPDEGKTSCDDEVNIIARLTREKDEAQALAADLEKQKTKMEAQMKKIQKELNAAKKDKLKYESYIGSVSDLII